MLVANAPKAPTCILHPRSHKTASSDIEQENFTQGDKSEDEYSINSVQYMLPKLCDEGPDGQIAMKNTTENSITDWKEELPIRDEYYAYRDKFIQTCT